MKMKERNLVGIYWGRFNPPHRGHMKMIRRFSRIVRTLVVVVGSSQRRDTKGNPFSGAERKRMLDAYVREEGLGNVRVVTHRDLGRGYLWALESVVGKCRPTVMFLPDNEKGALLRLARRRLKGRVGVATFERTGSISSTRLRDAIASDRKWEYLTGKSVAGLIVRLDGIARIKRAYGRDGRRGRKSA